MIYSTSPMAVAIFAFFVAAVLALSFYLGRRARSAQGYYAAHGEISWFVNGIAFAGDYLSAASFLGICGMIAFFGYDGFLYSIGFLAGWIVALFVIAEPIKRLGRFTFADALDAKFNSSGIKLTAAISTLVVSIFYLIPQMVGAGDLITPLLGLPHWSGVVLVGVTVTLIVVTAGMVSTTWVQFIKGSLLVCFCAVLAVMILQRGLRLGPIPGPDAQSPYRILPAEAVRASGEVLPEEGAWKGKPYLRVKHSNGSIVTWRTQKDGSCSETQTRTIQKYGPTWINGRPQTPENDLRAVGTLTSLPEGQAETGPLGPLSFLAQLSGSKVLTWGKDVVREPDDTSTEVYYQAPRSGADLLTPGASPTFAGVRSSDPLKKLDFLSLMLALFAGTASLPHILIRYYTVKNADAARKSTLVGIATIGFFYILTLYLGLGAMTSGNLDPTESNMSAPLLARSFNETLFAVISAIAFTTVLGTVSGLLMAASGAVAHDLVESFLRVKKDDHAKVRHGKIACLFVGAGAVLLGILFHGFNVAFLVGWAFNIAASANLPSLIMLLFWKRTTAQGITAAVAIGMTSSLAWILLSPQCYALVYKIDPTLSPIPFSQPALVTVPLGFLTLVVVSLFTQRRRTKEEEIAAAR